MAFTILDDYRTEVCAPEDYAGGTTGARGDNDGALDPYKLFIVTGEVKVIVYGVCTTSLAGASATLEVGITGNTALILPQITATTIIANDVWVDNSVAEVGGFVATALPVATHITNGNDIIETVATADVTSGRMYYVCLWIPISKDGNVKATKPRMD